MRPRTLAIVKPIPTIVRDRLGLWAMWLLLASGSLWFMNMAAVGRPVRYLIAMLLALTFLAVFQRILPTRADGRLLPRPVSAALLAVGSVVSVLYLWIY